MFTAICTDKERETLIQGVIVTPIDSFDQSQSVNGDANVLTDGWKGDE